MEPGAPSRSHPRAEAPGVSLLVVDGDSSVADALRGPLLECGFARRVDHAPSLREGIGDLAERPYDLVLLSLATPDAEGLDGIVRVRTIDPEVPIVVLSDIDDENRSVAAIQRGAQDCVVKGELDPHHARRMLRHAIERQRIMLELHAAREREQYLATHDHLTGIPNRALFYDRLSQAIASASRYGNTLAILFLDLDGFKPINDTLGHTAGDRLLQIVSQRIAAIVRKSDTVARIGGDEFALILSQISKPSDAATVAENILRRVSQPVEVGKAERCVGASIGISIYPTDGELADTLVRNADTAMYHAKKHGGGRYAFFNRRMRQARAEEGA